MATKNEGICGHCREKVSPIVIEENVLRRDKCQCPKCKQDLYACRSPGCDDYAKGSKSYDEELCPECTKSMAEGARELMRPAAAALIMAGTAYAIDKMNEKE